MRDNPRKRRVGKAMIGRSAFARQHAEKLVAQSRELLFSCERECDYAALLTRRARELRGLLR